jgi:hypothetical protein
MRDVMATGRRAACVGRRRDVDLVVLRNVSVRGPPSTRWQQQQQHVRKRDARRGAAPAGSSQGRDVQSAQGAAGRRGAARSSAARPGTGRWAGARRFRGTAHAPVSCRQPPPHRSPPCSRAQRGRPWTEEYNNQERPRRDDDACGGRADSGVSAAVSNSRRPPPPRFFKRSVDPAAPRRPGRVRRSQAGPSTGLQAPPPACSLLFFVFFSFSTSARRCLCPTLPRGRVLTCVGFQ